jgi:hypothetical protein
MRRRFDQERSSEAVYVHVHVYVHDLVETAAAGEH